jgi:hypothetical protein
VAGPSIIVRFLGDSTKLNAAVDDVHANAGAKIGDFAKKATLALGGAFAATEIVSFAKEAVGAASDLNESVSKTGVVFGTSAQQVLDWSKNAADAMGLSQQKALEAAGTYGNLAVSLGLPAPQAADMSTKLVGLAGDLASFNNVPVEDALNALRSGLTGETEPLKRFGVNINEVELKAEALRLGLVKTSVDAGKLSDAQENVDKANRKAAEAMAKYGAESVQFTDAQRDAHQATMKLEGVMAGKVPATLTAAEKAQASYSLMMKQTSTAQGDFARTSDGLANQQRIAAANMEDLKAKIGNALLPAFTAVTSFLTTSLLPAFETTFGWIMNNKDVVIAAVIGVAAVLLPMFVSWAISAAAAAAATLLAAAPFIIIGAAIAALAYLVIRNWDTIKAATLAVWDVVLGAIRAVWDWISSNWPLLLAILLGPFGIAVGLIVRNWDTIKDAAMAVFGWIRDNWPTLLAIITGPIGVAVLLVQRNWDTIKDGATAVYNWIRDKFDAIAGAISGAVGAISGAISSVVSAIKAPINALIGVWNGLAFKVPSFTIPSVDTHIPGIGVIGGGSFGGQTFNFPDLPKLAAGAILTRPTAFIGGEAGTELVTPERMLRSIIAEEGGGNYTLNIYPRTADAADVAYGFRRLELMAGAL